MKRLSNQTIKYCTVFLMIMVFSMLVSMSVFAAGPIYSFNYQGSKIDTYAYSSVVDGEETSGFRYFVKDGNLVVVSNQLNSVSDGIFIHYEDGESYIAVLTRGGKLVSLGTVGLTSKLENFKNSGITSLASNVTDDSKTVVVGYNTGAFVGYNCITGKEEFRYGAVSKESNFMKYVEEYVSSIFKKSGKSDTSAAKKEADEIVSLMNAEGYSLEDLISAGVFEDEASLNEFVSSGSLYAGATGPGTDENGNSEGGGNQEESSGQTGGGSDGSDTDNGNTKTEASTVDVTSGSGKEEETVSEDDESKIKDSYVLSPEDNKDEKESSPEEQNKKTSKKSSEKESEQESKKDGTATEKKTGSKGEKETTASKDKTGAPTVVAAGTDTTNGIGQGKGNGQTGFAHGSGNGSKETGGLKTDGTEKDGTIGVRTEATTAGTTGKAGEQAGELNKESGDGKGDGSGSDASKSGESSDGKDDGKETSEEKDTKEKDSKEKKNGSVMKGNGTQYVTVYNPDTESYEIYSVSELMGNPENPKSENSKLNNADNKTIAELLKVEEDEVEERGISLYVVVIAAVVILMLMAVWGISKISKSEAQKEKETLAFSSGKEA